MESEPITENRRIIRNGEVIGTVTIAYPNKTQAIVLGLVAKDGLGAKELKGILNYVKTQGYKELIFYRIKNGKEIEKRYRL